MGSGEVVIDIGEVNSSDELHKLLSEKLRFPEYYGMNFDAFWDVITDTKFFKMPKVLILKNHLLLKERLPQEYTLLFKCLQALNSKHPEIDCRIIKA